MSQEDMLRGFVANILKNSALGYIENIDTEDRIIKVNFDRYLVEYESRFLMKVHLHTLHLFTNHRDLNILL